MSYNIKYLIEEEQKLKSLPIDLFKKGEAEEKKEIEILPYLSNKLRIKLTFPILFLFFILFCLVRLPREVNFDPIDFVNRIIIANLFLLLPQILFFLFVILIFLHIFKNDKLLGVGLGILFVFIFMAMFAPLLAPYGYNQSLSVCGDSGTSICRKQAPNPTFIMGTTILGYDVYSRVI